jgi:hypothetical protein
MNPAEAKQNAKGIVGGLTAAGLKIVPADSGMINPSRLPNKSAVARVAKSRQGR